MLGISGLGIGNSYQNPYSVSGSRNAQKSAGAQQAQAARNSAAQGPARTAVIPRAQPNTPVQPVNRVQAPTPVALDPKDAVRRWENDPAELSGKGRTEFTGDRAPAQTVKASGIPQTVTQTGMPDADEANVPGTLQLGRSRAAAKGENSAKGVELPGFVDAKQTIVGASGKDGDGKVPGQQEDDGKNVETSDSKSAQEVAEESECQTCKNRKYQDGSDDPGVSFKTPTHVDPDQAASAVQGHEMEHVVRNQAEAQREGRRVVSQSVTYHTAICPECGRVYVSGGTTRTVTAADPKLEDQQEEEMNEQAEELKRKLIPGYDPDSTDSEKSMPGSGKDSAPRGISGTGSDKGGSNKSVNGADSGKEDSKKSSSLDSEKKDDKWTIPALRSKDDKEDDKQPVELFGAPIGTR